jgi:RNA polymerase sigma-70 factor (ECF subfamily)
MESVRAIEAASDRELVAQCQAGEMQAFDQLVRRHQQRAVNVAYQLLRNEADAVEVAQDAFVRVYRHMTDFRGDCEFTTWLHQIVVNLARNRHRWWSRRGAGRTFSMDCPVDTEDGPVAREFAAATAGPDQEVLANEYLEQVSAAVGRLPRKYREAVVLRDVEELSYEEIAVVLRCSVGTVKSRINRGREQLQAALRKQQG